MDIKLDIKELDNIIEKFNHYSTELLESNYADNKRKLRNLMRFIKENEIIYDYILDINNSKYGVNKECVKKYIKSLKIMGLGKDTIDTGETLEEQISFIYNLFEISLEDEINLGDLGFMYTSSRNFDVATKTFNKEISMILIKSISSHLRSLYVELKEEFEEAKYNFYIKDGNNILTVDSIFNNSGDISQTNKIVASDEKRVEALEILSKVKNQIEIAEINENIKKLLENSTSEIVENIEKNKSKNKLTKTLKNLKLLADGIGALEFIGEAINKLKNLLL